MCETLTMIKWVWHALQQQPDPALSHLVACVKTRTLQRDTLNILHKCTLTLSGKADLRTIIHTIRFAVCCCDTKT